MRIKIRKNQIKLGRWKDGGWSLEGVRTPYTLCPVRSFRKIECFMCPKIGHGTQSELPVAGARWGGIASSKSVFSLSQFWEVRLNFETFWTWV
jgi:hypothetical protein